MRYRSDRDTHLTDLFAIHLKLLSQGFIYQREYKSVAEIIELKIFSKI